MINIACYAPLLRLEDQTKWETATDGHKYHPAIVTGENSVNWNDVFNSVRYKTQIIKCGKCIGCYLDYSRSWANRGYLECKSWEQNYFITLTYDDEHLPKDGQLHVEDWETFIKALRQEMKRKFKDDGIRYMMCGEYGEENGRPHFHFIGFNLKLPKESFYKPRIKWKKYTYWQNKIIEKCWKKGIVNITEASWNTIAYVARYITKKVGAKEDADFYETNGIAKEFFRMSNHPGIGYYYYEEHKEEIYKYDQILITNNKGSHYVKPPKYFDDLYEKENPKRMKEIKANRQRRALEELKIKRKNTSLEKWEQMKIEERSKKNKTAIMTRKVEEI